MTTQGHMESAGKAKVHQKDFPGGYYQNNNPKLCVRPMHRSTLILGDRTPIYTTTHAESYSGRDRDGHALVFHYREPSFPSQHYGGLDLRDTFTKHALTHSREAHCPMEIIPQRALHSLGAWNCMLNRAGEAMREVICPTAVTTYRTTYSMEHCCPETTHHTSSTSGLPTHWHKHNILTGQERPPADPGRGRRPCRDGQLWAARRWETDCCSLRLY